MSSQDIDFLPCPSFSLRRNLKLEADRQDAPDEEFGYSFKFTSQFLSNAQDLEIVEEVYQEPEQFLAINMKISMLKHKI